MSADFIKMVADLSERRFLRTIQNIIASKTPCGFFFAPAVPADAQQIVNSFISSGVNVTCICVLAYDQKSAFAGVENVRVVSAEEFPTLDAEDKPKYIFTAREPVNGFFELTFRDYFARYGSEIIKIRDVNHMESTYNFYMAHLPELYAVHEMLADDESKRVFRASITGKITAQVNDFRFADEPQYFLNGFLPTAGDVAIDGGAYDGGTAVDFVRQGAKVYAFEMNAENYENCLPVAEKFGFTLENLGLSYQAGTEFYIPNKAGSLKIANSVGGGYLVSSSTSILTSSRKICRAWTISSSTLKARNWTYSTAPRKPSRAGSRRLCSVLTTSPKTFGRSRPA